jgi:hypothetical protein
METVREYKNDFLFFTFKRLEGKNYVYCSGVNVTRFLPITRGRHRPMSNPAIRGLQLVNLDVRSLALSSGARPSILRGEKCIGGDTAGGNWFTEALLIDNATDGLAKRIIDHCAVHLPRKMVKAIMIPDSLPDKPVPPDVLQKILEDMCIKYQY